MSGKSFNHPSSVQRHNFSPFYPTAITVLSQGRFGERAQRQDRSSAGEGVFGEDGHPEGGGDRTERHWDRQDACPTR
jgi:hypothetical protein